MNIIEVVPYKAQNETEWLYCRVLSFLKTAYYNDVLTMKPKYKNSSIELVAISDNKVVGLLDIEIEDKPKELCSSDHLRSAVIHHIAVHPEHQRKNIGQILLQTAEVELKKQKILRIEAWTRDDQWVRNWYTKNGFTSFYSYQHVEINGIQLELKNPQPHLNILSGFAHYTGKDYDNIKNIFSKTHECIGFEKLFT